MAAVAAGVTAFVGTGTAVVGDGAGSTGTEACGVGDASPVTGGVVANWLATT